MLSTAFGMIAVLFVFVAMILVVVGWLIYDNSQLRRDLEELRSDFTTGIPGIEEDANGDTIVFDFPNVPTESSQLGRAVRRTLNNELARRRLQA